MIPELSVVIPVRNESPNIDELYRDLTEALTRWGKAYEVIVVDDGSTDDSFEKLCGWQQHDERWRIIRFRRNFGQTAAFAAGIREARGRLIATSDGDLQNDPSDLPAMVRRIDEGFDIVCGWRKDRKDPWLTRRLPSEMANKLISAATGVKLHDYGCSLKVFRSEVIKPLKLYGEMHRFLPAIASQIGVTIAEMIVNCGRALLIDYRLFQKLLRFGELVLSVEQPSEGIQKRPVGRLDVHRPTNQRFRFSQSLVAVRKKIAKVVQHSCVVGVNLQRFPQGRFRFFVLFLSVLHARKSHQRSYVIGLERDCLARALFSLLHLVGVELDA